MSDPRSQQKQQEIMDLYKKHGVNPMGGCIPMLIQMPFLYAFYKVLSVSIEMRHAPWLWVADLSQPEHFDIHFLPLIMIVTSFMLQKMTPTPDGWRSQPAENDAVHAAHDGYLLLVAFKRSGVILPNQQFSGHGAAVVLQQDRSSVAPANALMIKDGRKRA